jgi:hypothetical protein
MDFVAMNFLVVGENFLNLGNDLEANLGFGSVTLRERTFLLMVVVLVFMPRFVE